MSGVTESRTSAVINKSIQEVWEFVTVPANWVRLQLGTWKVHGSGGEEDTEPPSRTMKTGEHFFEYMCVPGRFDFIGDWVVTKNEAPHTWGFKSVQWFGHALPTHIEATYTLEKIDENTTRWSRHRVNTPIKQNDNKVDFLAGKNDLEEMYQVTSKAFIERGEPMEPPLNAGIPHGKGWIDTLEVTNCEI